jgi:hypothetical protein
MPGLLKSLLKSLLNFILVPFRLRTWLNLTHLLLGMPLGLIYFTVIVTGLSLGISLLPILWGALVLAGLFLVLRWITLFERFCATWLLGAELGPMAPAAATPLNDWTMVKRHLGNRVTWTGPLYLLLKFPIGLAAFVIGVTGFSLAVSLTAVSLGVDISDLHFYFNDLELYTDPVSVALAGVLAGLLTCHLLNGLAALTRMLARGLLGLAPETAAAVPPQSAPVTA